MCGALSLEILFNVPKTRTFSKRYKILKGGETNWTNRVHSDCSVQVSATLKKKKKTERVA